MSKKKSCIFLNHENCKKMFTGIWKLEVERQKQEKENMKINRKKTSTGVIFSIPEKRIEYLYVGDYMNDNIKADFLGLSREIHKVAHKEVDLKNKMVITISTQKGCPMKCNFCDVPKYGYFGNIEEEDLYFQVKNAIEYSKCKYTDRLNIHFARMGEPTFNTAILDFTKKMKQKDYFKEVIEVNHIHPVLTTMLPEMNEDLEKYLLEWCYIKNDIYNGEAGLQLSINTTNEKVRNESFKNQSLHLKEISKITKKFPKPKGRKYTLNFAVDEKSEIDVNILNALFDKEKFIVKITPIHETKSALENEYGIIKDSFDVYRDLEQPLVKDGWDVLVFIPSDEEDKERITCGNLLLSDNEKENE